MTTIMEGGQFLRLTRMSLPFLLGTFVTENRTWAEVLGFVFHFANGIVFAIGYGLFFEVVGRSDWWLGAIAGVLHAVFVLTVVIPVTPAVRRRRSARSWRTRCTGRSSPRSTARSAEAASVVPQFEAGDPGGLRLLRMARISQAVRGVSKTPIQNPTR